MKRSETQSRHMQQAVEKYLKAFIVFKAGYAIKLAESVKKFIQEKIPD